MTATLEISGTKAAVILQGKNTAKIAVMQYGAVESALQGVDSVLLAGMSKPAKLNKYIGILQRLGYAEIKTEWLKNCGFEGKNSDVLNFRIEFGK